MSRTPYEILDDQLPSLPIRRTARAREIHCQQLNVIVRGGRNGRVIAVTSPAPGLSTTICARLTGYLTRAQLIPSFRVAVVDAGVTEVSLARIVLPTAHGIGDIATLTPEHITIENLFAAMTAAPVESPHARLMVRTTPSMGDQQTRLTPEQWAATISLLRRSFDLVLIDVPPSEFSSAVAAQADNVLVASDASYDDRRTAASVLEYATGSSSSDLGLDTRLVKLLINAMPHHLADEGSADASSRWARAPSVPFIPVTGTTKAWWPTSRSRLTTPPWRAATPRYRALAASVLGSSESALTFAPVNCRRYEPGSPHEHEAFTCVCATGELGVSSHDTFTAFTSHLHEAFTSKYESGLEALIVLLREQQDRGRVVTLALFNELVTTTRAILS